MTCADGTWTNSTRVRPQGCTEWRERDNTNTTCCCAWTLCSSENPCEGAKIRLRSACSWRSGLTPGSQMAFRASQHGYCALSGPSCATWRRSLLGRGGARRDRQGRLTAVGSSARRRARLAPHHRTQPAPRPRQGIPGRRSASGRRCLAGPVGAGQPLVPRAVRPQAGRHLDHQRHPQPHPKGSRGRVTAARPPRIGSPPNLPRFLGRFAIGLPQGAQTAPRMRDVPQCGSSVRGWLSGRDCVVVAT